MSELGNHHMFKNEEKYLNPQVKKNTQQKYYFPNTWTVIKAMLKYKSSP